MKLERETRVSLREEREVGIENRRDCIMYLRNTFINTLIPVQKNVMYLEAPKGRYSCEFIFLNKPLRSNSATQFATDMAYWTRLICNRSTVMLIRIAPPSRILSVQYSLNLFFTPLLLFFSFRNTMMDKFCDSMNLFFLECCPCYSRCRLKGFYLSDMGPDLGIPRQAASLNDIVKSPIGVALIMEHRQLNSISRGHS